MIKVKNHHIPATIRVEMALEMIRNYIINPYGTNVFFDACVPGGSFLPPPRKSSIHVKELQICVTYQI